MLSIVPRMSPVKRLCSARVKAAFTTLLERSIIVSGDPVMRHFVGKANQKRVTILMTKLLRLKDEIVTLFDRQIKAMN